MQVSEDQKLLREKLLHLSGVAGIDRMEYALSETRSTYFGVKDDGSPVGSPMILSMPTSPTPLSTTASSSETNISYESNDRASRVVRSLFKETNTSPGESNFSSPRTSSDSQLGTSSEKLLVENEVIVNEFLHEHHYSVIDEFDVSDHIQNNVEVSTYCINVSIDLMANFGYNFGLMLFLWPLMLICSYILSHQV